MPHSGRRIQHSSLNPSRFAIHGHVSPSNHKLDSLPHVVLPSNADWDPNMANNEIDSDNVWYNALDTEPPPGTSAYGNTKFDQELGYYRQQVLSLRQSTIISPDTLDNVIEYVDTIESFYDASTYSYDVNKGPTTADTPEEYEELRRFSGWIPAATIQDTFKLQLAGHDTLVPTLFVNTSSLAFPLLSFINAMNLSQLIPFSRTHQPLTMVQHARRSSLAPRVWSLMPMGLSLTENLLPRWKITSANGKP